MILGLFQYVFVNKREILMRDFFGYLNWTEPLNGSPDNLHSAMGDVSAGIKKHHYVPGEKFHQFIFKYGVLQNKISSEIETSFTYGNFAKSNQLVIVGDILLTQLQLLASDLSLSISEIRRLAHEKIIFLAYQRWGEECVYRLYGEFAFALWDEASGRLFCARDHIGIAPFYYINTNKSFIFSSRLEDLIRHLVGSIDINERYICEYLVGRWPNSGETVYQNIQQIPNGHFALVNKHGLSLQRYWNYENYLSRKAVIGQDEESYYRNTQEAVINAVRDRLDTKRVGINLSGGLDSSSIACCAALCEKERTYELTAFSKVPLPDYMGEVCNEVEYIREILKHHGQFTSYTVTDEPLPSQNNYQNYFNNCATFPFLPFFTTGLGLSAQIKKNGIMTALSGEGGDEFLSNSGSGVPLLLAKSGNIYQSIRLVYLFCKIMNKPFLKQYISMVIIKYLGERSIYLRNILIGKPHWSTLGSSFIKQKYMDLYEFNSGNILDVEGSGKSNSHPHFAMKAVLQSGCNQMIIENQRGVDSMFGYTTRYPLLDRKVIELCLGTPAILFFNNGWKRNLIRESMREIVPEINRLRKGWSPFSNSFASMMRENVMFVQKMIKNEKNELAWKILDRERIQTAYDNLLNSTREDLEAQKMAIKLSQCIGVVSFLAWLQTKGSNR
ncbi:MAG TPA: hypothetical protein DEG92_03045 [Rikenellaceae bacterium]|nr:hypothetical protein [Rikenellaceae bacterium]